MKRSFNGKIQESSSDKALTGKRFRVILLQEGLGNLESCFYYTKQAIQSAVNVFHGAQMYSNHPSRTEDMDRPERSVRDLIGHFENVAAEEIDGRLCLVGDAVMIDGEHNDWAREAMAHAVQYSQSFDDKSFIGLSINASGDAEETSIEDAIKIAPQAALEKLNEAKSLGIESVRVTNNITDCFSCDLVTRAGAGGKVIQMLEGDKKMDITKENEVEKKEEAAPVVDATHDDEAKDKELIKSMLDKYLGEGHGEEEAETFRKVSKEYESMDMSQEEAAHAAGKHMAVAKKLAPKEEEVEVPAKKDEEIKEEPKKDEEKKEEPVKEEEKKEAKEEESKKESDKVIELTAKVAKLEAEIQKRDLEKHIESTLAGSKIPRAATKQFKEAIGEVKTQKEFDSKVKLFIEAYTLGASESNNGFAPEKTVFVESESAVDFSDCIN